MRWARGVGVAICAAVFGLAFIAAPHSCAWGLDAYVWSGVAAMAFMFAVPLVFLTDRRPSERIIVGFGFSTVCAIVWITGFFMADMRIVCRLF